MKKIFFFLIGITALGMVGCLSLSASMKKSLAKKIENKEINFNALEDGIFTGHSELGPVKVEVMVEVDNHKLKNVELLKHECGLGHPADVIVNTMVEQNTLDFDAVSGATVSSEIIKNAVNKAMRGQD